MVTADEKNAVVIGAGYVGSQLARELAGSGWLVWALRRKPVDMGVEGITAVAADVRCPETLSVLRSVPQGSTVFITVGADAFSEAAYRATYVEGMKAVIAALDEYSVHPKHILFTSSTSVYAQMHGEWVDERSVTEPKHFSGRTMLDAEGYLRASGFGYAIVRLGGIYGPGRTPLLDKVRTGTACLMPEPSPCLNSIHRDDAAGILRFLAEQDFPEGVYLGVDHEPTPRNTVISWLAEKVGLPRPAYERGGDSPQRGGNRRCSSAKIRALGYKFRYPTFREGYMAILGKPSHDAEGV
jgi:nucleoside-diphosphate-sugar epimerase